VKIAVAGKGGVGKTFVAGALAYHYAEKGFQVLAIDADPAPNLAVTLGIPPEKASKILPLSENKWLIESKTSTGFPGVYNLTFTVDDIVRDFSVQTPLGANLLVMGTIRSVGAGCTCPANALLRALIRHLVVEREEVIVMDMEAGVEHMGRGTAEHMDVMLVVTDSNLKALEIANKIDKMAKQAGIRHTFLVGNKVSSPLDAEVINNFSEKNGLTTLELIPYDRKVLEADMRGESPLKHAEGSQSIMAIRKIGEKLLDLKI